MRRKTMESFLKTCQKRERFFQTLIKSTYRLKTLLMKIELTDISLIIS